MSDREATISLRGKCPHCGTDVLTSVKVEASEFLDAASVKAASIADWYVRLTPEERDLAQLAESTGLLSAYMNAGKLAQPDVFAPKNPAKSLLGFLRSAIPHKMIAQEKLALIAAFGNHEYSIMRSANGVAAIFIDDVLSWFIPLKFLSGIKASGSTRVKISDFTERDQQLQDLVRTKMGYIPRGIAPAFAQAMKKRSFGEFADVSL